MKRILIIVAVITVIIVLFRFCDFKKDDSQLDYNTNLIQQKILNVGKLVVTEGHFSEVVTFKDQDQYLMGLVSFEKKALIVVNAEVTVSYDLHQIKYDIDERNKTISIKNIPDAEIKIHPNLQFYDVDQSKLNPFSAEDYNKINKSVRANLEKKVSQSSLKSNAQNRLISELGKMLILTQSMGWKLQYEDHVIESESDFNSQLKG